MEDRIPNEAKQKPVNITQQASMEPSSKKTTSKLSGLLNSTRVRIHTTLSKTSSRANSAQSSTVSPRSSTVSGKSDFDDTFPEDFSSSITSFKSCTSQPSSNTSNLSIAGSQSTQKSAVSSYNKKSKAVEFNVPQTAVAPPSEILLAQLCDQFQKVIVESRPEQTWLVGYSPRTDADFLQRFLFVDKFNVEKAMKRYKSYYATVIQIPKVQSVLAGNVEFLRPVYARIVKGGCFHFYGFDARNRVVLSLVSGKLDPQLIAEVYPVIFDCLAFFEYFYTTHKQTMTAGVVWVVDHQGFTMSHFKEVAFNRDIQTIHGKLWSGTVPVTLSNIWICNEGRLINGVFKIFKPFLAKKVMDRVRMVGKDTSQILRDLGGASYTPDFIPGGTRKPEPPLAYESLVHHLRDALPQVMSS